MSKKKKNSDEALEEFVDEMDSISEESPYFNATAYLPVYNKERKAYDMFLIRVDTDRKKTFVEIEEMRYDTEARALHDVLKRYSNDSFKKGKK